jgi:hypothetical protein
MEFVFIKNKIFRRRWSMSNLKFKLKSLLIVPLFLAGFLIIPLSQSYAKDLDIGVSIRNDNLRDFYFSIGDYYSVPVEEVVVVKKRAPFILEEEIPILFLIVREAAVEPDLIIKLRRDGYSWHEIMLKFGLKPERVFEKYIVVYGPPYGKAWGYNKNHPRKVVILHDRDLIELSNIKFLSEYYYKRPEVVVEYKRKYPTYIDVHHVFYVEKKGKHEHEFKHYKHL